MLNLAGPTSSLFSSANFGFFRRMGAKFKDSLANRVHSARGRSPIPAGTLDSKLGSSLDQNQTPGAHPLSARASFLATDVSSSAVEDTLPGAWTASGGIQQQQRNQIGLQSGGTRSSSAPHVRRSSLGKERFATLEMPSAATLAERRSW